MSEPAEVQQALQTVSQALRGLKVHKRVTWRLYSGFDDVAVWRTIWEQQEHVVSRIYHTDRKVAFQDRQGQWHEGDIEQATGELRPWRGLKQAWRSSGASKCGPRSNRCRWNCPPVRCA